MSGNTRDRKARARTRYVSNKRQRDDPGERPVDGIEEVDPLGRRAADVDLRAGGKVHRRNRGVAQHGDEVLGTGRTEVLATDHEDLLVTTRRIDEGQRVTDRHDRHVGVVEHQLRQRQSGA